MTILQILFLSLQATLYSQTNILSTQHELTTSMVLRRLTFSEKVPLLTCC